MASALSALLSPLATVSRGDIIANDGQARYTKAVGQKFHADGTPRPFPGSTQITHIPPDSDLFRSLARILDEAAREPVMQKFALMPRSSLHMTLMDGIDDEHRAPPLWPRPVPVTASLETAREWCGDQLKDFHTGRTGDFRMVQRPAASKNVSAFLVLLQPADEAMDREIRGLRDRLSDRLQIREPGHDTYGFHITLGYLIEHLTPEETSAFGELYQGWMDRLFAAHPVVTIGQPEFCYFSDMFAFETRFKIPD